MKKYYLYKHIREDKNEVFYVGLGTKNKQDIKYNTYTRAHNKIRRNKYWKNTVNKIVNYKIEIFLESDSYEEIKNKEIELISFYGRKDLGLGTLTNMTDGGDGQVDRFFSEETRKKISIGHIGKKMSLKNVEKLKKRLIGNKNTFGKKLTDEHKKKISESSKGRKAWNKGRKNTEEDLKKQKQGIEKNRKFCSGCDKIFDSANYSKRHGGKCLIGSIKHLIPAIKQMYFEGKSMLKISKELNIKYKAVYKLKENKII